MKCHDCGREMPQGTNDDTSGWVTVLGGNTYCDNCLRLSTVESKLLEVQHAIINHANYMRKLEVV